MRGSRLLLRRGALLCLLVAGCASGGPPSQPLREAGGEPFGRLVTFAVDFDPSEARRVEDRLVRALGSETAAASHEVVALSQKEGAEGLRASYRALGFDRVLRVQRVGLPGSYVQPGGWSEPILFGGGGEPEYATLSLPQVVPTTVSGVLLAVYDLESGQEVWRSVRELDPASSPRRAFTEGFAAGVAHELRKAGVVAVSPRRSDPSLAR